jgi:hypothetical protein
MVSGACLNTSVVLDLCQTGRNTDKKGNRFEITYDIIVGNGWNQFKEWTLLSTYFDKLSNNTIMVAHVTPRTTQLR